MEDSEALIRARVKRELRRRMKAIRTALPGHARAERSLRVATRVESLDEWQRARVVAGFVAIRGEVDPSRLGEAARNAGKTVALPRVDLERQVIVLHRHVPGALVISDFGIPEPPADAPELDPAEIDFVAVPALAVDPSGQRVGYGKGFYDRLLPTLPQAFRCALIYDFQLIPEAPATEHDVPVHAIATDARLLRVGSGSS